MAKVTMRKKKRTTDSRTRCVTTRCCVECPRPSRRRRRRQVASKSKPLSRAMPMPLPSLQNIMPSPFMPLNVPLPRVEANRRPHGTYQKNNQPYRTQQKSTRDIGTLTDNMVRGTTSQKLPITNAPVSVPPPTLVAPSRGSPGRKLLAKVMGTPQNPFELPNELDLKGMNALGVANQGQNLRQNPGVKVAREELLRSQRQSSFDEGESVSSSNSGSSSPLEGYMLTGVREELFGGDNRKLMDAIRAGIIEQGVNPVPAARDVRRVFGEESKGLTQQTSSRPTTMTMGDLPIESSGGAGARMASDTSTDISN